MNVFNFFALDTIDSAPHTAALLSSTRKNISSRNIYCVKIKHNNKVTTMPVVMVNEKLSFFVTHRSS